MSALTTSNLHERSVRPAARLDRRASWSAGKGGADELVVLPAVPVSGFCTRHLLPFVGQVKVAQLPGAGAGALRSTVIRRAIQDICGNPQHPGTFASTLADRLELLPGSPGVLIEAELRSLCGHCSSLDPRHGSHRSLAVRGGFRLQPDLAESVLVLLQDIGRNPSASGR